jgi:hypothetical protein
MEAAGSSETLVPICQTMHCYEASWLKLVSELYLGGDWLGS